MVPTTLHTLLPEAVPADAVAATLPISRVTDDSRDVAAGDLFVAVRGLTVDGHDFAAAAVAAGAAAVIAERPLPLSVPLITVADSARALGTIASRLFASPADRLALTGITGTNGKTTTAYLLESILQQAGRHPGLVGTVTYRYPGTSEKAPYTTPTALRLQQLLAQMRDHGCQDVVMEVSSHGLLMGRLWGTAFSVAAFSHLSQDHLDLHGSMENYLAAKLRLFTTHLRPGGTAVVNLDGHGAAEVIAAVRQRADVRPLTCSLNDAAADVTLSAARAEIAGITAALAAGGQTVSLHASLVGAYNAENILLACACGVALGVDLPTIARGIAACTGIPGRLERVFGPAPFSVFVDFAHTPDALRRVLAVLRPVTTGRLIVVFGCGGDRDRKKRPLMGQAVAEGADIAVVTSDNPRSEDPQAIIDQIRPGLVQGGLRQRRTDLPLAARGEYLVSGDRQRAIRLAISLAQKHDTVLLAGKGHEDYQLVGNQRLPFDDREHARAALGKQQNQDR